MKKAILYLHGKGGTGAEAERFAALCPGCTLLGLDYTGTTPWETEAEILAAYRQLCAGHDRVLLLGNSIGAYFGMHALQGQPPAAALFISPIVDMERLILDMMAWAGVTEPQLQAAETIETPFGETLSWAYLCYARAHPIRWAAPTAVLYAENDNLTARPTIEAFAARAGASLTVMPGGEHWFHTPEQLAFLEDWLAGQLPRLGG